MTISSNSLDLDAFFKNTFRPHMLKQIDTSILSAKTSDSLDLANKAPTILLEAADTLKERAVQRDSTAQGERSMKRTVEAFNALTGKGLTEAEGWEFMVLLKLVRGRQGAFRKDDYVDGAAYCALLGECESKAIKQ